MSRTEFSVKSALAALIAAALVVPAPATASMEIGQPITPTLDCEGPATYLQQSTGDGPGYVVPNGRWVITKWTVLAYRPGASLRLGVFRPTGNPGEYETTGASDRHVITGYANNTFATRIPVQPGDTIGLLIVSGTFSCAAVTSAGEGDLANRDTTALHGVGSVFGYTDPSPANTRVNVGATIERDRDRDGFGDQTQDRCPTDRSAHRRCR